MGANDVEIESSNPLHAPLHHPNAVNGDVIMEPRIVVRKRRVHAAAP